MMKNAKISHESKYLNTTIEWIDNNELDYPYRAHVGNEHWKLRLNDFPAENLYTLFIDGEEKISFDDWPDAWLI